jgi:hypothetical protein
MSVMSSVGRLNPVDAALNPLLDGSMSEGGLDTSRLREGGASDEWLVYSSASFFFGNNLPISFGNGDPWRRGGNQVCAKYLLHRQNTGGFKRKIP